MQYVRKDIKLMILQFYEFISPLAVGKRNKKKFALEKKNSCLYIYIYMYDEKRGESITRRGYNWTAQNCNLCISTHPGSSLTSSSPANLALYSFYKCNLYIYDHRSGILDGHISVLLSFFFKFLFFSFLSFFCRFLLFVSLFCRIFIFFFLNLFIHFFCLFCIARLIRQQAHK